MKKVVLTAIAVFGFTLANAQTEKGKWLVSGGTSLEFSSAKSKAKADNFPTQDGPKISSFNIKPAVGYFVAENFMIGLSLDYETSTIKFSSDKVTENSISVIPQVGYYFGKSNVKPFLNAGLGFASVSNSDVDSNLNGTVLGINGGVAYFVSKSISLDFGVGYQSLSVKVDETNFTPSYTNTTSGFVSQFGIAVYF